MSAYVGVCLVFLPRSHLARGHETTAGALTWALHALTLYPEMQKRLRTEIQSTVTSDSPSYNELEKMHFMNNFTKEVLRYYPPGKDSATS